MNIFRAIFLLFFLTIPPATISLFMPAISKIHLYFSVSFRVAELNIWILLLGYLIGQLIYIPLSKRYNSVVSLQLGLVLMLITSLLLKLAINLSAFWLFQLGEFILGLGLASCFCCTYAIINSSYTHNFVKKLLPFSLFPYAFLGAGATLVSSYFAEKGMWQDITNIIPGMVVLALIGTLLFKKVGNSSPHPAGTKAPVNYKILVIYAFGVGVTYYMSYGYSTGMPSLATQVLGISLATYGTYTFLTTPLVIPAFFLSFYSLKVLGARKSILYSSATAASLVFILYALRFIPYHIVIPLFVVVGFMNISAAVLLTSTVFLASNSSTNTQYAASLAGFINVSTILAGLLLQDTIPFSSFNNFLLILFPFLCIIFVLTRIEGKGTHAIN